MGGGGLPAAPHAGGIWLNDPEGGGDMDHAPLTGGDAGSVPWPPMLHASGASRLDAAESVPYDVEGVGVGYDEDGGSDVFQAFTICTACCIRFLISMTLAVS